MPRQTEFPQTRIKETPWCAYGRQYEHVGKATRDFGGAVNILYSQGQRFPIRSWDIRYVRMFKTPLEAIEEAAKGDRIRKSRLIQDFKYDFPDAELE